MPNTSTLSKALLLCLSINLLSIEAYHIVPCDRMIELISFPSKFEDVHIPAKIRVIPSSNQIRIQTKVSTQFWVKNLHDFDSAVPILSFVMNKNTRRYAKLFVDPLNNYELVHTSKINFNVGIMESHMFRVWSRINVDLEFNHVFQNEMQFVMTIYVDGSKKRTTSHTYDQSEYWELQFLDVTLGEDSFFANSIRQ